MSDDPFSIYPPIQCTNCATPSPTTQQVGKYIDAGLSIDINSLGHYGGFTDNYPLKDDSLAHLCHDCSVKLFDALPGLAEFADVHIGHCNITPTSESHSDGRKVKPCCQYCWTWDTTDPNNIVTYRATKDLTWELTR